MAVLQKYHQFVLVFAVAVIVQSVNCFPTGYNGDSYVARCYEKLETALDTMLKMNQKRMGKDEDRISNYPTSNIEVRNLRVRLPAGSSAYQHHSPKWYKIDKCQFMTANRTLSTKLLFPDLQISGQVMINPNGDYCNMILRMRHAVIEFVTIPLQQPINENANDNYFDQNNNNNNSGRYKNLKKVEQTVRTDSHFIEPGFISVFAHGCGHMAGPSRTSSSSASSSAPSDSSTPLLYLNDLGANRIIDNDKALDNLDEIFSNGVRSLLTTYMQRHLQPAIKETLMESMGYKLSYG